MKAVILLETKKTEVVDLDEPILNTKGWAKIKVVAAGLCGSDIQKISSDLDITRYVKTNVLGHEFSGIIIEIKGENLGFSLEDRVTGIPLIPCYSCKFCKDENFNLCPSLESIGKTLPGAFADYLLVPLQNLRKIPNSLRFEEAALTDTVAVGVHTYHLSASPKRKEVLILGDGPLGFICAQIYRFYGNKVKIVGKYHSETARLLDVPFTNSCEAKDISSNSYDVVIEAVGRSQQETINHAIRITKPCGIINVTGVFEIGFKGSLTFRDLFYKEVNLVGVNSYSVYHGKSEFDTALEMMVLKQIDISPLITHILPLSQFNEGLNLVNNRGESKCIKIVYKP